MGKGEKKEQALKLLSEGKSYREVAKLVSVPFQTVFSWSKEASESDTSDTLSQTLNQTPTTSPVYGKSNMSETSDKTVSDTLDEALAEEESDLEAQIDALEKQPKETLPSSTEETIPISEIEHHLKSPTDKRKDLEYTERIMSLLKENSHLKTDVARLRGSSKTTNWNNDSLEEKAQLELEMQKIELAIEKEFLRNVKEQRLKKMLQGDEDDPLKRLERLATIRAFAASGTKENVDVMGWIDKLSQQELQRWQRQQQMIQGEFDQREKLENRLTEKIKGQLQGQKSGIEKLKEGAAVITDTFEKAAKTLKEHGIVLGQPTQPPPPPSEYQQEAVMAEKAGILPQLPKDSVESSLNTFGESLPEESEAEESEPKFSVGYGSTREIAKKRGVNVTDGTFGEE